MEVENVSQELISELLSDSEDMHEVNEPNRRVKDQMIKMYTDKLDRFVLENEEELPDFVLNSRYYKERKEDYIHEVVDQIFEASSSQEVALTLSQLPNFIQNHEYIHKKLGRRTNEELSSIRVVKNLNEVFETLQMDNSSKAFDQRVMLAAAVIDPRYGPPKINETRNVLEKAKAVKKAFLTGDQSTLQVLKRKKREIYPKEVFDMAIESWETDATVVEPAMHARPERAISDGQETVPNRLQVLTDDEAYDMFKEKFEEKVKQVMKQHSDKVRSKYEDKQQGTWKTTIMNILQRKENLFPSKTWFIRNKPPQTKANHDHTTGVCKDCYSSQLNYETLLRYAQSQCNCKTDICPNWVCTCNLEEDDDTCSCDPVCYYVDCMSCKVRHNNSI